MKPGRTLTHGDDPAPFVSSFPSTRQKQELPTGILVPSNPHPSFGELSGSPTPPIIRRKPLPPTASPLARLSQTPRIEAIREENKAEVEPSAHHLSPTLLVGQSPLTPVEPPDFVVRNLDRYPHGQTPIAPQAYEFGSLVPAVIEEEEPPPESTDDFSNIPPSKRSHAIHPTPSEKHNNLSNSRGNNQIVGLGWHNGAATMSLYPSGKPPNLSLSLDANSRNYSSQHDDSYDPNINPKPKSPGAKFTSFFGWKTTQSPGAASSSTAFSEKSSPAPSPLFPKSPSKGTLAPSTSTTLVIDIPRANDSTDPSFFDDSGLSMPPTTPGISKSVDMEEELRQITSELASSIKREMDLEDLVDRLQSEANQPSGTNRRTSDYFSDSGNSSIRYPQWDGDSKQEEFEKLQRRAEQEKAQLRLELTQKAQEERSNRKRMEAHIRQLQEQISLVGHPQVESADASERIRELEVSLEDARRRLLEERQVNANFEDLLGALRSELQGHQNERDNLRDEIVPQLQARVEGLESEAADLQRLTYENTKMQQKLQSLRNEDTKMQQELQSLRNENNTLVNARKLQLEMQQQQMRFNSIAEEGRAPNPQARVGLTRSNTVARNSISGAPRSSSLSRSNSLKDRESRETLADRVKDTEIQRDALHRALKSLLERQEYQERETAKRVRVLKLERDRAHSDSPRRMGYDRNIWRLREEVNHLRRRADEALLQKWQCEKGLGGLKMDLDRAEQETSSLRQLLLEHDILIPEQAGGGRLKPGAQQEIQATSASLEKAYKDLQATHALSLSRIEGLESSGRSSRRISELGAANAETEKTMELLKQSITKAEVERDLAQKQAEEYRQQAGALREAERGYMAEEQNLADQLRESAIRIEGLAGQVRQQLASNSTLRERLAEAVSRGEREQRASAARINEMQSKLKSLEERLMTAQQHSEEAVSKHEEEIKALRESHNAQLQRMKNGLVKTPGQFSPKTPLSPFFTGRSPRLDRTTSGKGISMSEATKTGFLEKRVEELENALSDADKEMEEVVGRMNMAQIEVMELQSERLVAKPCSLVQQLLISDRDEAMRQTRKLQAEILQEREAVKAMIK
ncbi:hypothetical protein FGG08_001719 [Glutinoglossum americanum]|uniref:DUF7603 domain-containing protein n=1 Tax=Glutinoglossum americanum TaxID=1670608 RepID=A0A9P8I7T9_9PEZI|nr:hypothetical protein FGG08_001719 [Glutinoglossum americanum]